MKKNMNNFSQQSTYLPLVDDMAIPHADYSQKNVATILAMLHTGFSQLISLSAFKFSFAQLFLGIESSDFASCSLIGRRYDATSSKTRLHDVILCFELD
jgi:hypothetical protein